MSAPAEEASALRGGRALAWDAAGLRLPASGGGTRRVPWDDLLHVSVGPRGLRLSTPPGVRLVSRAEFVDRLAGPEEAAARIREACFGTPGGALRRARMGALDALAARPGPAPVTWLLAGVCLALFAVGLFWPEVHYAGLFSPVLVGLGEPWRLVTANLLHAGVVHLLLNLGGLVVLGWITERSLGHRAMVLVAGASALGAMGCSWLWSYESAVGASGIVYGLAGALVWVEFRRPDALPAAWRVPRLGLVALLLLETVAMWQIPYVAHAAHWGGFAAGAAVAAWAGPRTDGGARRRLGPPALAVAALFVLSLLALYGDVAARSPGDVAARGERLLRLEAISPVFLNNEAWRIAVAPDAGKDDLRVARRMAERAVAETRGLEATFLDTLAEIDFRQGEVERALRLIDAAIALDPEEPYYREQRRRFTGERAPDDRPPEPSPFRTPPSPEAPPLVPSEDAIRV